MPCHCGCNVSQCCPVSLDVGFQECTASLYVLGSSTWVPALARATRRTVCDSAHAYEVYSDMVQSYMLEYLIGSYLFTV
jgi:hypothetical protein